MQWCQHATHKRNWLIEVAKNKLSVACLHLPKLLHFLVMIMQYINSNSESYVVGYEKRGVG